MRYWLQIDDVPIPHKVQTRRFTDYETAAFYDVAVQWLDVLVALARNVVQVRIEIVQECARQFIVQVLVYSFPMFQGNERLAGYVGHRLTRRRHILTG